MDNDKCCHFIQGIIHGPIPDDQYIKIANDITLHFKDDIITATNNRTMDSSLVEQMNMFIQHLFKELNDESLEAAVFTGCFQYLCNNVLRSPSNLEVSQYEKSLVLFIITDMCEHKVDQLLCQLGVTNMLMFSSQLLQCHCDAIENCHISFHDNHSNHLDNLIFGGQITLSIALGIVTMVMTYSQQKVINT